MNALTIFVLIFSAAVNCYVTRSNIWMSSKYLGSKPVFVAGGSNGIGYEVVKKLSALGTPVHALVRRVDSVELLSKLPGVKVTLGDAMKEDDVQKCMEGCVAAITTLGGRPNTESGMKVDYAGNSNVIEQAGILGVERIILVTSVGCGDTKTAVTPQVYRILEEALVQKTKAERDLKTYTNLDWTIIRPGGLKTDVATGKAILTEDKMAIGVVNRVDCAEMVIKVLGSTGTCTRRELACIDPSQDSSYADVETEYKYTKFRI
eukprot:gene12305-16502_t